jgi:hypothetical protein
MDDADEKIVAAKGCSALGACEGGFGSFALDFSLCDGKRIAFLASTRFKRMGGDEALERIRAGREIQVAIGGCGGQYPSTLRSDIAPCWTPCR